MKRLTIKDKRTKNGIRLPGYCSPYEERVFNKLCQLEDVEEELGIDLITLFKALSDGIYLKIRNDIDLFKRPRLYYSDDFKCWGFELGLGAYYVHLEDYGTLWSLRKEDLDD